MRTSCGQHVLEVKGNMLCTGGKNLNFVSRTGKISPFPKGSSVGICCSWSYGCNVDRRLQFITRSLNDGSWRACRDFQMPEPKTSKRNKRGNYQNRERDGEKENAKLVTYNVTRHKHQKQHSKHSRVKTSPGTIKKKLNRRYQVRRRMPLILNHTWIKHQVNDTGEPPGDKWNNIMQWYCCTCHHRGVPGTNKHTILQLMQKKKPVNLPIRAQMKRIHHGGAKNKTTSRNEPKLCPVDFEPHYWPE